MSTVSVVIPTTGRSTLVASVESALDQTRTPDAVLVVYDGAKSDLAGLRRRLPSQVDVIATGAPSNANVARNLGIKESDGELIALLDDDDLWLPHKLEVQTDEMTVRTGPVLVSGTRYQLRGRFEGETWPQRGPFPKEDFGDYLFRRRSVRRTPRGFQTSTLMATRESFQRIPLNPSRRVHQDWDWLIRAAAAPEATVFLVDEVLSIYVSGLDGAKPSLSGSTAWKESVAWIMEEDLPVSPKARSDFLLTVALNRAAETASPPEIMGLVRSAHSVANPSLAASLMAVPRIVRAVTRRSQHGKKSR